MSAQDYWDEVVEMGLFRNQLAAGWSEFGLSYRKAARPALTAGESVTAAQVAANTRNIQAALNGGGAYILPGTYLVAGGLSVPCGAVLVGESGGTFSGTAASRVSKLKLADGSDDHLVVVEADAWAILIQDLELDGNKANQSAGTYHGVYCEAFASGDESRCVLERLYVHDCKADGIHVGANRRNDRVANCSAMSCAQFGFKLSGTDAVLTGCDAGLNGSHGINVAGSLTRVTDCNLFWNKNGLNVVASVMGVVVKGCSIDRNYECGVILEAGAHDLALVANVLHSNSQTTDDTWPHVSVGDNVTAVLAHNCFAPLAGGLSNKPTCGVDEGAGVTLVGLADNYHAAASSHDGLECL